MERIDDVLLEEIRAARREIDRMSEKLDALAEDVGNESLIKGLAVLQSTVLGKFLQIERTLETRGKMERIG